MADPEILMGGRGRGGEEKIGPLLFEKGPGTECSALSYSNIRILR